MRTFPVAYLGFLLTLAGCAGVPVPVAPPAATDVSYRVCSYGPQAARPADQTGPTGPQRRSTAWELSLKHNSAPTRILGSPSRCC